MATTTEALALIGDTLSLPPGMDEAEWAELGANLVKRGESVAWSLVEWLRYGIKEYGKKRSYTIAQQITCLSRHAVIQYASVGKKCTRVHDLSFSHHRAVAALPAARQKELLEEARAFGYTEKELRKKIKAERAPATTVTRKPRKEPTFTITARQKKRIEDAVFELSDRLAESQQEELVDELRDAIGDAFAFSDAQKAAHQKAREYQAEWHKPPVEE